MREPDLGKDYSGIDLIRQTVRQIRDDISPSYGADVLDAVLWILDDYKRLKQGRDTE